MTPKVTNVRMRFIFAFLLLSISTFGQQGKVDSLLEIVSHNGGDAQTFSALKSLGEIFEKNDPERAIAYYRHAMEFPFRTNYAIDYVKMSNSLGELYHNRSLYDSSFLVYRQSVSLAQKFNFNKELGFAIQGIGLNFMRLSQHDSARAYFNQLLALGMQLKDLYLQASANNNLGNVALEEGDNQDALEKFIKAAELFEKTENISGLGKALVNIGNIENILGHFDKALEYTQRSLAIAEKNHSELGIAYGHRLIGRIYRKQKNYEKALEEYRLALEIYSRLGNKRDEGETYQSIANIYFDQGKYQESLIEGEKSIRIAKSISNSAQMAYTYSSIAFAWYQLKRPDKAVAYFDSSASRAREIKNRYLIMDAYQLKSEIYAEQNQFKKALEFHQLYSLLKDSLTSEENRQATEELEAKYQNTKKQAEIDVLHKDQQLKNVSLKQSRTVQSALITAVVLLLVIGLLVFNRSKMINQAKRQMEIERMRNQIARDLHDDMGSTLSSINLISQVALQENSPENQSKHFRRISEQSAKMMESMSDMVWSINPDNDTLVKTVAKMKEFSAEMLEPRNMGYEFKIDEGLNDIALDVAKRKNLFLIFKEAINNAAKYSGASFVSIAISQSINELLLTIRDNGKGFDLSNPPNGNGLRNMRERAREISAGLRMESTNETGTVLEMNIPLT